MIWMTSKWPMQVHTCCLYCLSSWKFLPSHVMLRTFHTYVYIGSDCNGRDCDNKLLREPDFLNRDTAQTYFSMSMTIQYRLSIAYTSILNTSKQICSTGSVMLSQPRPHNECHKTEHCFCLYSATSDDAMASIYTARTHSLCQWCAHVCYQFLESNILYTISHLLVLKTRVMKNYFDI